MKSDQSQTDTPQLAPPGGGLPLPQKLALRYWFGPIVSRLTSSRTARTDYEKINRRIIELVKSVPLEKRTQRILIEPLPGLEDSSRYWSLNGVLEHLMIVSRSVEGVILALSAGRAPEGRADVARVKPTHHESELLTEFEKYAPGLLFRIDESLKASGGDLNSTLTFDHPWFGPFNARQWYWLLSAHSGIHLNQVKAILRNQKNQMNDR